MSRIATLTLHTQVDRRWEPLVQQQFSEDQDAMLWASMLRAQQMERTYVRADFYATVRLIEMGAYGRSWEELRDEVDQAIRDGEYGELEEVGTSDMNHMIVGRVSGVPVLNAQPVRVAVVA